MNANSLLTTDYANTSNWKLGENKANTKPKQTQTNPISEKPQMNVNSILTKDYENIYPCGVPKNKPNSNPIPQRYTQYAIREKKYTPNVEDS